MQLTRVERLLLANQYRILEALYPKGADMYAQHCEIVERGYVGHYEDIAHLIAPDADTLSAEQCSEVVNILMMFDHLQVSFNKLPDKSGIDPELLEFSGFDGNSEGSLRAYVKHFCKMDGGRFQGLRATRDFNSHHPALGTYRRMLEVYKRIYQHPYRLLTKEEIQAMIQVRYPHAHA